MPVLNLLAAALVVLVFSWRRILEGVSAFITARGFVEIFGAGKLLLVRATKSANLKLLLITSALLLSLLPYSTYPFRVLPFKS